ncbi:MAG: sugar nucleotide-binding protein, partial [Ignavibacteriaceae bacterium]|nr:sugar nucleotide-binding protein [Ignavibacteriaceae bacterium]
MKKILITGGSGLLGQYLNLAVSSNNKILTTYNNHPGNCREFLSKKIDILNEKELKILFQEFQPEIVIHTAAFTNPLLLHDQNPKDIYALNVNTTKRLAELCDQHNSKLIYLSTDLVYAGYRGSM